MNIGAVKHKTNGKEGDERKEWFELIIRPPFMDSHTFSMHKNTRKQRDSEPDYKIWTNYNRKGEKFRGIEVGAVWKKKSRDGNTTFLSASIESPAFASGKINVTLFETKVFEGESAADIDWIYDVVWKPQTNNQSNSNYGGNTEPHSYTQGPSGNQIPVHVENGAGVSADEARNYM